MGKRWRSPRWMEAMGFRVACWGLATLCVATPSLAYEDDVHYGLTHWLARAAGFLPAEADTIAHGNVDYDRGGLSAIPLVKDASCFFNRDPSLSKEVRRIHFPSEGPVPGTPLERRVDAGSAPARSEHARLLAVPGKTDAANLESLGQSLHPLQDSWSHQGIPDSPFAPFCDSRLSWGHPVLRGGFWSHDADLSHKNLKDAIAMADATWAALCEYQNKLHQRPCKRPFAELSPEVLELLQATTKTAKAKWFKDRGYAKPIFLYAISVPDGGDGVSHEPVDHARAALQARRKSDPAALPNTPEAEFMEAFFRDWMTEKNIASLAQKWIALGAYRGSLGQGDPRPVDATSADVQLRFWRVGDHGSLQQSLEGTHQLITLAGARPTPIPDAIRQGERSYQSLADALLPFDGTGLPIVTWASSQPGGRVLWIGAVRFRHAPSDLVFVVAERIGGAPRVVSIDSLVTD